MIVVTGPGRSGTSVLLRLYQELGVDVDATWRHDVSAGLEDPRVVAANRRIGDELGMVFTSTRVSPGLERLAGHHRVPSPVRAVASRAIHARTERSVARIRWDRRDDVARAMSAELRSLAAERAVAKDPQFLFTIGTWAAAGAAIDHVVLAMRSVDAAVTSRTDAGLYRNLDRDALATSVTFGVGLCVFDTTEHDIPLSTVRFPDFLDDPEGLYAALPFPREVRYDEFADVLRRVADPSSVRFGR